MGQLSHLFQMYAIVPSAELICVVYLTPQLVPNMPRTEQFPRKTAPFAVCAEVVATQSPLGLEQLPNLIWHVNYTIWSLYGSTAPGPLLCNKLLHPALAIPPSVHSANLLWFSTSMVADSLEYYQFTGGL